MKAYLPVVFVMSVAATAALLLAVATNTGPSQAAAFAVTKTADTADGTWTTPTVPCGKRSSPPTAAVGADTITVPAGTYTLTIPPAPSGDAAADGDLDVTDDVTVTGAGAGTTTIDGNGGVTGEGVLQVLASNARLADLTITNGGTSRGGGIHNLDWSSVGIPHPHQRHRQQQRRVQRRRYRQRRRYPHSQQQRHQRQRHHRELRRRHRQRLGEHWC